MKCRYFVAVFEGLLKHKSAKLYFVPVANGAGCAGVGICTHELRDSVDVCGVIQLFARIKIDAAKEISEGFQPGVINVKGDENAVSGRSLCKNGFQGGHCLPEELINNIT